MSLDNLKIDSDVEIPKADTLPGSGYTLDTGLYPMIIDLAYMKKSSGGAQAVVFHFKDATGGSNNLHQTFYVTSGDAKGNKNYYIHQKSGKKVLLPGMQDCNTIVKIASGKNLSELVPENKTIKVWDSAAQEEKPKEMPVLTELLGKNVLLGVHKVRENVRKLNDATKQYEPTAEERLFNEVHKSFFPEGITLTEKAGGATEPEYRDRWVERFPPEYVKDNYKPVATSQPDLPSSIGSSAAVDDIFN